MCPGKTKQENRRKAEHKGKDRAAEVANTFEWLITAFMLAFVFRAFVMEAFRIPTGSMADTLKGAHFRLRCRQCGYQYDYGFVPEKYGLAQDTIPPGKVRLPPTRCPSCGFYSLPGELMPVANGDRILVLKCIYQFVEPHRWDVVVFKNPLEPTINYIKRLVGRPGETVEIIDGDVYINGRISRKPPKVQKEMWMPVFNNDYQPVRPQEGSFNGRPWQQPFRNINGSKWVLGDKDKPTLFRLDSPAEQIHTMIYDSSVGNDFRATYAYDDVRDYKHMPYCSDLMVRFFARSTEAQGRIGVALSKYENTYQAWVDYTGEMVITRTSEGNKPEELRRKPIKSPAINKFILVKFANVDHELVFQFGDEKLSYDLGVGPDDAGRRKAGSRPEVKIFGSGELTLSHIAIFRDIHYRRYKFGSSTEPGRGTEGRPFTLGEDEFFVLGDNSPNSEDSRWWNNPGIANNYEFYREGIVPRDYLVGKALFVYWPSGFEFPWPESVKRFLLQNSRSSAALRLMYWIVSWRWIPNVGQMRFIYGGSNSANGG